MKGAIGLIAAGVAAMLSGTAAHAESQLERGAYLVQIMGCGDCHTPGHFFGKPDVAHKLSGSDVGFVVPGLGYFWGTNLTPDRETGIGNWTNGQIIAALRKGIRPDGRILAPAMPWRSFAALSDRDAAAIAAYLKTLPPTKHRVAGPLGPDAKPAAPYMMIKMPD